MRAGRLRNQVTIQTPTETRSGTSGQVVKSWATLATVWAGIEPLSGRELIAAGAEQSEHDIRIVCRYLPDLTTRCRVLFGARIFQILGVINRNERGAEMELRCTEQGTV
jgi:SPP1 family predicted phage head-tail adaptor